MPSSLWIILHSGLCILYLFTCVRLVQFFMLHLSFPFDRAKGPIFLYQILVCRIGLLFLSQSFSFLLFLVGIGCFRLSFFLPLSLSASYAPLSFVLCSGFVPFPFHSWLLASFPFLIGFSRTFFFRYLSFTCFPSLPIVYPVQDFFT